MRGNGRHTKDDGQDEERVPPAEALDQPPRNGQKDGAGESRHGRQDQQRSGPPPHEPGRGRGERGLVERQRDRDPDSGPDEVEPRQTLHARPCHEQHRPQHGAERHRHAGTGAVEPVPERRGEDHGHEERERVGPGDLRRRPAELGLHGDEEDGEGVVEDAPGDRLGDGQRPDDRPAVIRGLAARAPRRADHAPPALSRKVSSSPSALVVTSQRPGAKRPGTPPLASKCRRIEEERVPVPRVTPHPVAAALGRLVEQHVERDPGGHLGVGQLDPQLVPTRRGEDEAGREIAAEDALRHPRGQLDALRSDPNVLELDSDRSPPVGLVDKRLSQGVQSPVGDAQAQPLHDRSYRVLRVSALQGDIEVGELHMPGELPRRWIAHGPAVLSARFGYRLSV